MQSKYDIHKSLTARRLATLVAMALVASACGGPDDDDSPAPCVSPTELTQESVGNGGRIEKGCYTVGARLAIKGGQLEIAPGTSIVFAQDAGLSVESGGSLSAVGTATDRIFLTGAEKTRGYWRGLYFYESNSSNNKLEHVVLSHGGSGTWHGGSESRGGIFIRGSNTRLSVSNSTFTDNAQAAIVADGGGSTLSIADTAFKNNESPLWLHANLPGNLSGLTFEDNEKNYIRTGFTGETISTEQTWKAFAVPYRSTGKVQVRARLTLDAGVTIEFAQGIGFDVSDTGRLKAQGTAEAPVTLTGVEKEQGYWAGIYFYQSKSQDNVLEHATIEYGGGTKWHGGDSRAGIYVRDGAVRVALRNVTFRENAITGLFADSADAELTVDGCTFEKNETPAILHANLVGALADDNTFKNNTKDRIVVGTGNQALKTTQTWNAFSVPYYVRNKLSIGADTHLTIAPGVVVEFAQDAWLYMEKGTLGAEGTTEAPIRFIAADGETGRGFWAGIGFNYSNSSKNVISNAEIISAGSAKFHGGAASQAAIFLYNASKVALSKVAIRSSGKYGVSVSDGSSVDPCADVTYSNNADSDVFGPGTIACN